MYLCAIKDLYTHWIEGAHDRKDGQRVLGKLTPIEYEAIMKQSAPIAA